MVMCATAGGIGGDMQVKKAPGPLTPCTRLGELGRGWTRDRCGAQASNAR